MSQILPPADAYDAQLDVVIVGGGACGLTAALRLADAGVDVAVLERDVRPTGSTAMSSGFVPAPGTRFQRIIGVEDIPTIFADDIQKKAARGADPDVVAAVTKTIGPALEWLADAHGLDWQVLDDFLYPGHRRHRMHAVPEKTGAGLMSRLHAAAETAGVPVLTQARVTALHADGQSISGVTVERPGDVSETIGCKALILACNGYGGNIELVAQHIPEISDAPYYGHVGNTGDAVLWGQALGADVRDLTAYQGHGSLAKGQNILITWALMMEGGIQVNASGLRFANEHRGYSEQAVDVLAQSGAVAWNIYDERLHQFGLGFPDYRVANEAGAILCGADVAELARKAGLPGHVLQSTLSKIEGFPLGYTADPFGRVFDPTKALKPPYYAIKVTGALFHTQGGLSVDASARVLFPDGAHFPNLFAAGGAARGVSGSRVEGYLSGNGLLTAIGLGDIAGRSAAELIRATTK